MLDSLWARVTVVEDGDPLYKNIHCGPVTIRARVPILTDLDRKPDAMVTSDGKRVYLSLFLKNDRPECYAFHSIEQRGLFEQMIKIPGIGPGLAARVLDELSVASVRWAVRESDAAVFKGVKGVGAKTAGLLAERLKV